MNPLFQSIRRSERVVIKRSLEDAPPHVVSASNQPRAQKPSPAKKRVKKNCKKKSRDAAYNDRWECYFGLLIDYHARFGTTQVPRSYQVNGTNLGEWVKNQRYRKLKPERKNKLEKIGFFGEYSAGTSTGSLPAQSKESEFDNYESESVAESSVAESKESDSDGSGSKSGVAPPFAGLEPELSGDETLDGDDDTECANATLESKVMEEMKKQALDDLAQANQAKTMAAIAKIRAQAALARKETEKLQAETNRLLKETTSLSSE